MRTKDCLDTLMKFDERIVLSIETGLKVPFVKLEISNVEQLHYKTESGSQQSFSFQIYAIKIHDSLAIEQSLYEQYSALEHTLSMNAQIYNKTWNNNGTYRQEDGLYITTITMSFSVKNL